MSKIAFVFPGQGAQYTAMAKDFYEKYAVSRKVFENASKASGLDVEALCFEENDRLNITEYTQIALHMMRVLPVPTAWSHIPPPFCKSIQTQSF